MSVADSSADIIVVGAGFAGTVAAAVLTAQGRRTILVDPCDSCPPVFKAEKIERPQIALLQKFGLRDCLLPHVGHVREVQLAHDGRVFKVVPIEQYGISYADLVNVLRANLPEAVQLRQGRVESINNGGAFQRMQLSSGEELSARLVVLACGINQQLQTQLGLRRRVLQKDQSIALGFMVERREQLPFDFDALTYYPERPETAIDYLTLFRVRGGMRANLFMFRTLTDPWVRAFHSDPTRELRRTLPKLARVLGDYQVAGRVESAATALYDTQGAPPPGIVAIGDALQNVCPSTGLGLAKALIDVDVLAECIPAWFEAPGEVAALHDVIPAALYDVIPSEARDLGSYRQRQTAGRKQGRRETPERETGKHETGETEIGYDRVTEFRAAEFRVAEFYDHPRKLAMDQTARNQAYRHRQAVLARSLSWRIYRTLLHWKRTMTRPRNLSLANTTMRRSDTSS